MPMSKNGVASVVLLSFLEAWNMVEQPVAYLKEPAQYPLSVAVAYVGTEDAATQLVCCLLSLLPPLLAVPPVPPGAGPGDCPGGSEGVGSIP